MEHRSSAAISPPDSRRPGTKKPSSLWKKTSVPGLRIYRPTGQYYAHFKANGKAITQRLETSVCSIAVQRLRDQKALHRGSRPAAGTKKVLTFSDALADYRHLVEQP